MPVTHCWVMHRLASQGVNHALLTLAATVPRLSSEQSLLHFDCEALPYFSLPSSIALFDDDASSQSFNSFYSTNLFRHVFTGENVHYIIFIFIKVIQKLYLQIHINNINVIVLKFMQLNLNPSSFSEWTTYTHYSTLGWDVLPHQIICKKCCLSRRSPSFSQFYQGFQNT